MLDGIKILAPAKINIGLCVLPKRADGFHNIESIFQTVGLYDVLKVTLSEQKNTCVVRCGNVLLEQNNTITLTYNTFCHLTGCSSGVVVDLEKHIPMGAGLGGGSSDAAYFLKALACLNKVELTDSLADQVASQVGSDVFFFLHSGEGKNKKGCAIVTGRGEFVRRILPREDLFFLLIFPEVHSSTKEAYELVDRSYEAGSKSPCPNLAELESVYNGPVQKWTFVNSFTSVLVQKYAVIGKALQDIKMSGALWADMSGSGSTVFGVFSSKEEAQRAQVLLKKSWNHCVLA